MNFNNNYINIYAALPKDWPYEGLYYHLLSGDPITNGEHTIVFNPLTARATLTCPYGCCDTTFPDWLSLCSYLNDDWDAWSVIASQELQPL